MCGHGRFDSRVTLAGMEHGLLLSDSVDCSQEIIVGD